ncbi:DUF6192 family protein [Streptomyces sp. NPDC013953]|uniref:DUF6192 family protein n=1 Tax=Streptomyces sp. NPDC013953 TaxID=3364868 RepID=UPI0036F9224E
MPYQATFALVVVRRCRLDRAGAADGRRPSGSGEDLFGVDVSLQIHADDLRLSLSGVRSYLGCRPPLARRRRCEGVSHKIHCVFASIPDDTERFEAIEAFRWTSVPGCGAGRRTWLKSESGSARTIRRRRGHGRHRPEHSQQGAQSP